ncbi:MAG: DUF456 domain-containing protein [Muribaculaceae bacterium]|nr:DUF456 domain-containing protein [Muribaculaceae bacterium]MDE6322310.1 DUF456 domain-containing protein [Muribaculaceae bacterium]
MATLCIILGSLLMCGAITLVFRPIFPGSILAYAGLWAFHFSGYFPVTMQELLFWGVATVLVVCADKLLPRSNAMALSGRGYVGVGTLAGMIVGMLMASAGIILGAVIGAFLGAMAFSRTPQGRTLDFPSSTFVRFLCSRGLPAVITFSQIGLILYYSLNLAGY